MKKSRRIAIVGSRDFPRLDVVRAFIGLLKRSDIVVSGGARGVDSVAQLEAENLGLRTKIFPADWDRLGKSAGFIRNKSIVEYADIIVAFWDGTSKGTQSTMTLAQGAQKELIICQVNVGEVGPPTPLRTTVTTSIFRLVDRARRGRN